MNPYAETIGCILVVNGHAPMRALLGNFLRGFASRIGECTNGLEAIEAHLHERPDLLLVDVDMPEMDGTEATRRIVAQDPDIRIIVVTQHNDSSLRLAAREAGALGFVPKFGATALL